MNTHKNAPLTPKGREAMVRCVEAGLSRAAAARYRITGSRLRTASTRISRAGPPFRSCNCAAAQTTHGAPNKGDLPSPLPGHRIPPAVTPFRSRERRAPKPAYRREEFSGVKVGCAMRPSRRPALLRTIEHAVGGDAHFLLGFAEGRRQVRCRRHAGSQRDGRRHHGAGRPGWRHLSTRPSREKLRRLSDEMIKAVKPYDAGQN